MGEQNGKEILEKLLQSDEQLSDKLVCDLHLISDLASEDGYELLLENANYSNPVLLANYAATEQKQPTPSELIQAVYRGKACYRV